MITGDNEKSANAIGKIAGVDEVVAEYFQTERKRRYADLRKRARLLWSAMVSMMHLHLQLLISV